MTKKEKRMANESTYESTRANLGAQVEKNIKFNGGKDMVLQLRMPTIIWIT